MKNKEEKQPIQAMTKDGYWYDIYAFRGEFVELEIDKRNVRIVKVKDIVKWKYL